MGECTHVLIARLTGTLQKIGTIRTVYLLTVSDTHGHTTWTHHSSMTVKKTITNMNKHTQDRIGMS